MSQMSREQRIREKRRQQQRWEDRIGAERRAREIKREERRDLKATEESGRKKGGPEKAGNWCDKSWMAGQRKGRWEECIISHLLPPSLWGPYFPGRLPQRPDAPRRNPAQSGSGGSSSSLSASELLQQHLELGLQQRTVVVERSVEGMAERSAAAPRHTPFLSSLSNGGLGVRSFTARSSQALSLMVLQSFPPDKWSRHDDKLHGRKGRETAFFFRLIYLYLYA